MDFQSLSNAQSKRIILLKKKEGREKERQFIVEGARAVKQCLKSPQGEALLQNLIFTAPPEPSIEKKFHKKIYLTTEKQFSQFTSTETPQNIMGVFAIPDYFIEDVITSTPKSSLYLYLDNVRDPMNIGTIIRTAVWFGVTGIFYSKGTGDIYNPKSVRASAGSLLTIPMYNINPLEHLPRLKQKYSIVATALQNAISFSEWNPTSNVILVLGNEANGVTDDVITFANERIKIEGNSDGVESLNVATTAAILISHLRLQ